MTRFKGKVAIVTGAGTGIGAAIAGRFALEGADVILTGRRAAPIEAVAKRIGGVACAGDAADTGHMSALVDMAQERFGGLDVMVCNAGGFGFGTLCDTDEKGWDSAVHANLTTAYASCRAAIPALEKRGGNLLVMSSIAGLAAGPEAFGYVTMKHGLIGLTKSIARDFGPKGIRCNAICPGWVRTEMADMEMSELMARKNLPTVEEAYALVTRDVPLRKPAESSDVALAAAFLCSDEARMITGSILTVDGGATIVDVPTLAF